MRLHTAIPQLHLRSLGADDAEEMAVLVQSSRVHLTQHGDYEALVERSVEDWRWGLSHPDPAHLDLGLVHRDVLVGSMTLTRIEDRIYNLGYWIGVAYQGRGYVTAAGHAVLSHARHVLGATEIWAGISWSNQRSMAVVRRLGLVRIREQPTHCSFVVSWSTAD